MRKIALSIMLVVIVLATSGCATSLKKYAGPVRPRSELALLSTKSPDPEGWVRVLDVKKINGENLVSGKEIWKPQLFLFGWWHLVAVNRASKAVELLPGEHEVAIKLTEAVNYWDHPISPKSHLNLYFRAAAGHNYTLGFTEITKAAGAITLPCIKDITTGDNPVSDHDKTIQQKAKFDLEILESLKGKPRKLPEFASHTPKEGMAILLPSAEVMKVDGLSVPRARGDKMLPIDLNPGQHRVTFDAPSGFELIGDPPTLSFEASPGHTYYTTVVLILPLLYQELNKLDSKAPDLVLWKQMIIDVSYLSDDNLTPREALVFLNKTFDQFAQYDSSKDFYSKISFAMLRRIVFQPHVSKQSKEAFLMLTDSLKEKIKSFVAEQ
ncbi:MAG: hypothetical protein ABIH45_05490 [Candidatus Omnitrophota bacterium]